VRYILLILLTLVGSPTFASSYDLTQYDIEKLTTAAREARAEEREKQDLVAQTDMAYWAAAMFYATVAEIVVALLGTCLSAGALIGLLHSLKLARETNQIARHQFNLERRPRLIIEKKGGRVYREFNGDEDKLGSLHIVFNHKITNIGYCAALDVEIRDWLYFNTIHGKKTEITENPGIYSIRRHTMLIENSDMIYNIHFVIDLNKWVDLITQKAGEEFNPKNITIEQTIRFVSEISSETYEIEASSLLIRAIDGKDGPDEGVFWTSFLVDRQAKLSATPFTVRQVKLIDSELKRQN
jgi:hypothetical protein